MFPPQRFSAPQSLEIYSTNLTSGAAEGSNPTPWRLDPPETLTNGAQKKKHEAFSSFPLFWVIFFDILGMLNFRKGRWVLKEKHDDKPIHGSCAISFPGGFPKSWISSSPWMQTDPPQKRRADDCCYRMLPGPCLAKCFASKLLSIFMKTHSFQWNPEVRFQPSKSVLCLPSVSHCSRGLSFDSPALKSIFAYQT